jgi:hypothetical protein
MPVAMNIDSFVEFMWQGGGNSAPTGEFDLPDMNYSAVAFDLMSDAPDRNDSTSPGSYQAPSMAPEGFTRSPQEDDILICPKCKDILCEGESELKRQVWAVKTCGHVRSF